MNPSRKLSDKRPSRQKVEANRDLQRWKDAETAVAAKITAAVGGRELLRWRQQGAALPCARLTVEALKAQTLWPALMQATPKVRAGLLRFLGLVVACYADGGRPLCASWPRLRRLVGVADRTLRLWTGRLMELGALAVDAHFVHASEGKRYRHCRAPNVYAPGLLLYGAAQASCVPMLSRYDAERRGWVATFRERYDGAELPGKVVARQAEGLGAFCELSAEYQHSRGVAMPVAVDNSDGGAGSEGEGAPSGGDPGLCEPLTVGASAGADDSEETTPAPSERAGEGVVSAPADASETAGHTAPAGASGPESEAGGVRQPPSRPRQADAAQRAGHPRGCGCVNSLDVEIERAAEEAAELAPEERAAPFLRLMRDKGWVR